MKLVPYFSIEPKDSLRGLRGPKQVLVIIIQDLSGHVIPMRSRRESENVKKEEIYRRVSPNQMYIIDGYLRITYEGLNTANPR